MKIVLPGGSGQVGTLLARQFQRDGHEVVVLSRGVPSAPWRTVVWDARTLGSWASEVDGADVVINLAGRNVNCRYNTVNRRAIMDSRVESARVVGRAIAESATPPPVWLQASTATIYAHTFGAANDEADGVLGGNEPDVPDTWKFSIEVAKAWEREVDRAGVTNTRTVKLRSAIVLSPDRGGIFDVILRLVRLRLGGNVGDGKQFVSWIHDADFVRAVYWLIENEHIDDAVNIASPNPLPYADFIRELRSAWGVRIGLPATEWMLELGALVMRTETELVLKSRRVIPGLLAREGFEFRFPKWFDAARDLCERWRNFSSMTDSEM